MAKSDALLRLIKSLSRNEKKHFVFFSSKHILDRQNNYMELFYAVDSISEEEAYVKGKYNETILLKLIKTPSVKSNLSYYKTYLFDLILKSLRVYDSKDIGLIRIQKSILDINLLIGKNLLDQALKKIRRTKKLANKFQYEIELYKLCIIESKLLRRTINNIDRDILQIQILRNETDSVLKEIGISSGFLKLYEESFLITKHLSLKPSIRLKNLVEKHTAIKINQDSSFHQLGLFHLTCSNYYYQKKDYKKCMKSLKKLIDLFERNKKMITEDIDRYINTLSNYLTYCVLTGELTNFEKYIHKFNNIKTKNTYLNNLINQHHFYLYCIYYLRKENFEEAIQAFFPQLIKWLHKSEQQISTSRLMTFYYSLSITFFMVGNYENAKKWNNKVINMEIRKVRREVQAAARFFKVIIFHELGYYLSIESLIRSVKKYLKNVDRYGAAEHSILEALLKSSLTIDNKSREKIFQELASKIDQLEMKNREISTIKDWFKRKGNQKLSV